MADKKLKDKITSILREKFPHDTVDVSDGYKDNVHIIVVSREFDNMDETTKQDFLWSIIDKSDLTAKEKLKISRILPWNPAELK